MQVTWRVQTLGGETTFDKGMATHPILAWRIPQAQGPNRLAHEFAKESRHD